MALPRRNPNKAWEKLRETAAKARQPFDRDMLLNIAFFLDHQYVEWVPDAAAIRTRPRHKNEARTPRPVANKIMHFVQQEHAYALANRPTVDVLPATDDPLDVSIASVALAYLKWLSEPQVTDFDAELSEAVHWALVAGEGFLKWTWNAKEKRPDISAPSPLDVIVDPYCKKFRNARYIIHSQFMDVEQVHALYGKEIKPTQVDRADQVKSALLREMGQAPVLEGAVVNELWLRPGVSRKYPKGLFVTWAGREMLVEPNDFSYNHGRLPFTQLGSIPRPGTPHYTCAVKYLRSPQTELNKYHAQDIMTREAFANPKWWIPEELELQAPPDDSPRQILRGSGASGFKPEIIQPASFPDARTNDWIRAEMQDVVGVHEVSQAQVPGRVEAARAIELLKESDVSRLFELEGTVKRSISNGYWMELMLAKQYAPEEQIVQTYSREGLPEVRRFRAEKIDPAMRVQVTMGTGLARSRAARQDQAILMWEHQIITEPEIMSELMEIPVGTIAPQRAFDIKLARNENLVMASGADEETGAGTAIKPNSWDAHDVHIREHNNFRKTAEFEALDSEIKTKFEMHVQTHQQMELEKLMQDAKKQAIMAGVMTQYGGDAPEPEQPDASDDVEPTPEEEAAQQPQGTPAKQAAA